MMRIIPVKMIINARLLAILFLGLSSGLPLALVGSTLQAWFTEDNIPLMTIGVLTLLGAPYTFKFLWAPIVDHYRLDRFGGRRAWILLTQFVLCLSLLMLSTLDPYHQTTLVSLFALLTAFLSASQDIAIDAYRTDLLTKEERGLGAAYFACTYRIGVIISGGLALIFADYFGFQKTYQLMAVLMFLQMLPAYYAPRLPAVSSSKKLFRTAIDAFLDLLRRDKIVLLLLFVFFYKFGDALALSLMSNFLLHGLHFSLTEVGLAYKFVGFFAVTLGGFIGGLLLIRLEIYHALLSFGLAQAFSNLMFAVLAFVGQKFWLLTTAMFIENFCSGLSTAAFFAFLMSLCHRRFSASHYALLSAVSSFARVFLGPLAAYMVSELGWMFFYIWTVVLCFPGLLFLILLKEKVQGYAEAIAN